MTDEKNRFAKIQLKYNVIKLRRSSYFGTTPYTKQTLNPAVYFVPHKANASPIRLIYTPQSKRLFIPFSKKAKKQHLQLPIFSYISFPTLQSKRQSCSATVLSGKKIRQQIFYQYLLPYLAPTVGLSSQLSKAPPELSPKFSQQRAARKIWSFVSRPTK